MNVIRLPFDPAYWKDDEKFGSQVLLSGVAVEKSVICAALLQSGVGRAELFSGF
jgi:hypothetical protein